jgi:hypothetical protein
MRKVAFTLTVVAAVIAAFAVPAKTGQPSLMISNWNKAGPVEKVTYWRRYYRRYGYAAPYAYYPPAYGYYPHAHSYYPPAYVYRPYPYYAPYGYSLPSYAPY